MRLQRRKKFTLVEMLVVIAIIGILAALLMPSLQNARESSRALSCTNQLRQIGVGVQTYSNEQNYLPNGFKFASDVIRKYLDPGSSWKIIHLCPKSDFKSYGVGGWNWSQGSYSYNSGAGYDNGTGSAWSAYTPPLRPQRVVRPSQKIIDLDGGGAGNFGYSGLFSSVYPQTGANMSGLWYADLVRAWHNLRSNCLFLDGHVSAEMIDYTSAQAKTYAQLQ